MSAAVNLRKNLEKAVRELEWDSPEWSNQSCLGYVIQGSNDAGLKGEDGRQLVRYRDSLYIRDRLRYSVIPTTEVF